MVGVPWRAVMRHRAVSESTAVIVFDLASLHAVARSRLLMRTPPGLWSCRRVSSSNTRNSASLSVGAASARASVAASDNGYYVNLFVGRKKGPVPAESGPGLGEETDAFVDGNSYRRLPPLLLLPPPDEWLAPPPPEGRLTLPPPE